MSDNPTPPPGQQPPPPPAPATEAKVFRDDELVYVDPDTRTVVGPVEWNRNGNPKSRTYPPPPKTEGKEDRRRGGRKHYPWGTYKSMKGAFKLEGKQKKPESTKTLDDIMDKALKEAFWD